MVDIKRVLKIAILFILFIIFTFIISILFFSVLDKYNLLDNKIIKFVSTLLSVIAGVWIMHFLINKIH